MFVILLFCACVPGGTVVLLGAGRNDEKVLHLHIVFVSARKCTTYLYDLPASEQEVGGERGIRVGANLEPCRSNIGELLEQHLENQWGNIETTSAHTRNSIGTTSGQHRSNNGTTFEQVWNTVDTSLERRRNKIRKHRDAIETHSEQHRNNIRSNLEQHRKHIGTHSEQRRNTIRATSEQHRNTLGPTHRTHVHTLRNHFARPSLVVPHRSRATPRTAVPARPSVGVSPRRALAVSPRRAPSAGVSPGHDRALRVPEIGVGGVHRVDEQDDE